MQKLKLLVHICFLLPLLSSTCSVFEIENNKRLFVIGKIVDSEGNPIRNIEISTHISNHIIGTGESDSDGNFEVASLDSKDGELIISINRHADDSLGNPKYTTVFFNNNRSGEYRERDLYELGEIQLELQAVLHLETPPEDPSLNWKIKYVSASCLYVFNDYTYLEEQSYCFPLENHGVHHPGGENFHGTFYSLLGTTAQFIYSIENGPEQIINIPLNEENNSFVFEY